MAVKYLRIFCASLLAICVVYSYANSSHAAHITVTKFGNPLFKPVDFQLFSAPIGNFDSNFSEFSTSANQILAPPNHEKHVNLFIGPGAPHAGPYDMELENGVTAAGFKEAVVYNESDFEDPNAVILAFMNVPIANAPTGTDPNVPDSPDFEDGQIIPNSIFPLEGQFTIFRNDELFEPIGDLGPVVPALNQTLTPGFTVEGHSHFPFFFAESDIFADPPQPIVGEYLYSIRLQDQDMNGYAINASFEIVPEPSAMLLTLMGGLALVAMRRRSNT